MGVRFIIAGDANGQFKALFDQWEDAMSKIDFRASQVLHELCGGFRVRLTTYRRGTDEVLFKRYTSLYAYVDRYLDNRFTTRTWWSNSWQRRGPNIPG